MRRLVGLWQWRRGRLVENRPGSPDELRHAVAGGLQSTDDRTGAGHELELRSGLRNGDDQDCLHVATDVPAHLRSAILIFQCRTDGKAGGMILSILPLPALLPSFSQRAAPAGSRTQTSRR